MLDESSSLSRFPHQILLLLLTLHTFVTSQLLVHTQSHLCSSSRCLVLFVELILIYDLRQGASQGNSCNEGAGEMLCVLYVTTLSVPQAQVTWMLPVIKSTCCAQSQVCLAFGFWLGFPLVGKMPTMPSSPQSFCRDASFKDNPMWMDDFLDDLQAELLL